MAGYGSRGYARGGYAGSPPTDVGRFFFGGTGFGYGEPWGGQGRPRIYRPVLATEPGVVTFVSGDTEVTAPQYVDWTDWEQDIATPSDEVVDLNDDLAITVTDVGVVTQRVRHINEADDVDAVLDEDQSLFTWVEVSLAEADDLDVALQDDGLVTHIFAFYDDVDALDVTLGEDANAEVVLIAFERDDDLDVAVDPSSLRIVLTLKDAEDDLDVALLEDASPYVVFTTYDDDDVLDVDLGEDSDEIFKVSHIPVDGDELLDVDLDEGVGFFIVTYIETDVDDALDVAVGEYADLFQVTWLFPDEEDALTVTLAEQVTDLFQVTHIDSDRSEDLDLALGEAREFNIWTHVDTDVDESLTVSLGEATDLFVFIWQFPVATDLVRVQTVEAASEFYVVTHEWIDRTENLAFVIGEAYTISVTGYVWLDRVDALGIDLDEQVTVTPWELVQFSAADDLDVGLQESAHLFSWLVVPVAASEVLDVGFETDAYYDFIITGSDVVDVTLQESSRIEQATLHPIRWFGPGGAFGADGGRNGGSPHMVDADKADPRIRVVYDSPHQVQGLYETGTLYPARIGSRGPMDPAEAFQPLLMGDNICRAQLVRPSEVIPHSLTRSGGGNRDDSAVVLPDGRVLYVYQHNGQIWGGYARSTWDFLSRNFTLSDNFLIFAGMRSSPSPAATISWAGVPRRLYLTTAWRNNDGTYVTQMWRSGDLGRTWSLVQTMASSSSSPMRDNIMTGDILTMPNGKLVVMAPFVGTRTIGGSSISGILWGVWNSDDNGDSWYLATFFGHGPRLPLVGWIPFYTNTMSRSLAYHKGHVYALTADDYGGWYMTLYRSADGENWTRTGWDLGGSRAYILNFAAGFSIWNQPESSGFFRILANLALFSDGECLYVFNSAHPTGAENFNWDTLRWEKLGSNQRGHGAIFKHSGNSDEILNPRGWEQIYQIDWMHGSGMSSNGRAIFQRLGEPYGMIAHEGRVIPIALGGDNFGLYAGEINPRRVVYR